MYLAPIPTLSCLDLIRDFKYHLIESYWLVTYQKYREFYEELSKEDGHYLIIDNSEGIGHRVEDHVMMEWADRLCVQEAVIPDINPVKSGDLDGALKSLELAKHFKDENQNSKYTFMGVIHGRNLEEAARLLRYFKDDVCGFPNKSFIPREILMQYCNVPPERRHMLGASSVTELLRLSTRRIARSVDTNMPFRGAASNCHFMAYTDDRAPKFSPEMKIYRERASVFLMYLEKALRHDK